MTVFQYDGKWKLMMWNAIPHLGNISKGLSIVKTGNDKRENTMEYFYQGVKVSIWGKSNGNCTIVVEDKETADKLGGFQRHDEGYLSWFYKTVSEEEIFVNI